MFSPSQLHVSFNQKHYRINSRVTHSLPADLSVRTVNHRCNHHSSFLTFTQFSLTYEVKCFTVEPESCKGEYSNTSRQVEKTHWSTFEKTIIFAIRICLFLNVDAFVFTVGDGDCMWLMCAMWAFVCDVFFYRYRPKVKRVQYTVSTAVYTI